MAALELNRVIVDDTFAEAFPMKGTRLLTETLAPMRTRADEIARIAKLANEIGLKAGKKK